MYLAEPAGGSRVGVLVLSGSSGRVESERCDVLADAGAVALSYRWFGEAIDRIPLESFEPALDELRGRCDRVSLLGFSKGAEAALLLGGLHPDLAAVVAGAPSDLVWAALTDERPPRSSWTLGGEELPFVPYDDTWEPDTDPPAWAGVYRQSELTYAHAVPAARIPVERITAEVLRLVGGDDRVWPSSEFAARIVRRRADAGLVTSLVVHPRAGHRMILPGETVADGGARIDRGGSTDLDAGAGRQAWPELLRVLGLGSA